VLAFSIYFPSKYVVVPEEVSEMTTVAPISGMPFSSETVPDTIISGAKVSCTINPENSVKIILNLGFIALSFSLGNHNNNNNKVLNIKTKPYFSYFVF
tara:strand:+ start:600 stop:893 length:294 start_codon:yes stop_codon:yes gene_type:complete